MTSQEKGVFYMISKVVCSPFSKIQCGKMVQENWII